MKLFVAAFLFLSIPLVTVKAQTPAATGQYFFAIGGGHTTGQTTLNTSLGVQVGADSPIWNITTLVMQPGKGSGVSTVRTGIGWAIKQTGNVMLIGLADAGATANSTATLGNVGGGLLMRYDLQGISKRFAGQNVGISAGFRIAAIAGASVQPEYLFQISKKF